MARHALAEFERRLGAAAGLVLIDPAGRIGIAHTTEAMAAAWRSEETRAHAARGVRKVRVRPGPPRYLQRSVLRDALKAQCGAGAGPAKRSSPHCPVCATGESITRVPLMGIAAGDRP